MIDKELIDTIFLNQLGNQYAVGSTNAFERKTKLKNLLKTFLEHRIEIQKAMFDDFRKPPAEVDLTEIYTVTNELKHAIKHLKSWMKPKAVTSPITLLGTSSYIHYEPKGLVLIISPWNFPFNLTFGPLVSAIASGNCVIIKPSEHTPNSSRVIKKILLKVFPENEVAVFEGDADVAEYITKKPFNHIFFTGSPALGKKVMNAAAENLCSVTLELGGKSPVIVDESADLSKSAKRIAWAKFLNNGQVCIAPDYLYVHEKVKEDFLSLLKAQIIGFYSEEPEQSKDYSRIVNQAHFNRLKQYLQDAISEGAVLEIGGETNEKERFVAPTVLSNVNLKSAIMQEEIFGPILPLLVYKDLNEVILHIQQHEKPLALYIFSKEDEVINKVIRETRAGGTVINHNTLHFFNNELPFGGSNNSGIGKAHGKYGFEAFSNARAVMKQWSPFSALDLLMPPYSNFKQKIIDLTIRFF